ncbi:MAG: hypothetical protein KC731_16315 [Myxococcales bacterium]|nr:hypothetical protein [Myxococcales bacterium]
MTLSSSLAARRLLAPLTLLAPLLVGCGGDDEVGGFELVSDFPGVQALGTVWSFAPDDVWVTAEAGRLFHFDGTRWEESQLDSPVMMLDAWGFAPDDLWLVGGDQLARYDGSTWTVTVLSDEDPGIEDVVSIWGSSPSDVWVVGSQSTAAHFDGTSWQRMIAGDGENSVVWGSGPDDVYLSGIFGMAHWDGSSWQDLEVDWYSGSAEGIWGFGANDVWLASGSNELAHYDGSSWTSFENDFTAEAAALWGSSSDDIWGVGTPGGVIHYDGSEWTEEGHQEIGAPYLRQFHAVHGSGQGDVWIVGTELGDGGAVPQLYRR